MPRFKPAPTTIEATQNEDLSWKVTGKEYAIPDLEFRKAYSPCDEAATLALNKGLCYAEGDTKADAALQG